LTLVEFNAANLGASHLGHIVENSITQRALWQTAEREPDVTLFTGQAITALHQTAESAAVSLEDGNQLSAQLVIGADGARSQVREMSGCGVARNQYQRQAMVISVRDQGEVEGITLQGFFPSGPRAFRPVRSAGSNSPGETWGSLVCYD